MPSPFPGMNPYLEQESVWQGFHSRMINTIADALVPQVRPNYIVEIEEHTYIHELPPDQWRFVGRPDVALADQGRAADAGKRSIATMAPAHATIPIAIDEQKVPYLAIKDRLHRDLVTVIELLSPSNKRTGPDRGQYIKKRLRFMYSSANFVEIDLLRGGSRLPFESLPPCDYYAIVSRVEERPQVALWPLRLRDRLPDIPIPLRPPHGDASIDLQQLFNKIYDAGGYDDYIYAQLPEPPLKAEDAEWAKQFVST